MNIPLAVQREAKEVFGNPQAREYGEACETELQQRGKELITIGQELQKMGKLNFELSWYYSIDDKISSQVTQFRMQMFEKAGFKVRAIGVPKAKIRTFTGDQNAPVNIGKTPTGWCSDWPSGTSWSSWPS